MTTKQPPDYKTVLSLALRLTEAERLAMSEALASSIESIEHEKSKEEAPLSDSEINALMNVDPLPPAEIIARGLTGTWAHKNIGDGAEWVNEQKAKRQARNQW